MENMDRSRDERWVQRMQEGDRDAFEAAFCFYYDDLCHFAEYQVGVADVAEDLVQDVFVDLWNRRQRWHLRTTLRAYLFGAVRNHAIKYIAHQQVKRRWEKDVQMNRTSFSSSPSGPDEEFRFRELRRRIQKSVAELPERCRQVYVLSRQHGLTYKEIAETMDISPKTVENQMVHALKFLRRRLKQFLPAVMA